VDQPVGHSYTSDPTSIFVYHRIILNVGREVLYTVCSCCYIISQYTVISTLGAAAGGVAV